MKPQLLIGAITQGSGKTAFAAGLTLALWKRGMNVQPYKCGSEFSDASLLTLASGNAAVNLDTWICRNTHVQHLYNKHGEKADVCIVDGTGGLFDGYRRIQGSNAETAKLLNIPVVLLVNARAIGYSIAAVLYGFKQFHPGIRIAGVIFNQIVSEAHYNYLREACTDVGIDCLGYLPDNEDFNLPKRMVWTTSNREGIFKQIERIAEIIKQQIDITRLLNRCNQGFPCQYALPYSSDNDMEPLSPIRKIRIAIARDPAFYFTYRENIAALERIGKISWFTPIYGSKIPDADLVYLPGGHIEMFARQVHRRRKVLEALRDYAENGGKIWAEGAGMVLLGRSLTVRSGGTAYSMAGVLPFDFYIDKPKLQSGYRKTTVQGMELKGFEYQYFRGPELEPLYRYKNVIASYAHWYWGDKDLLKMW